MAKPIKTSLIGHQGRTFDVRYRQVGDDSFAFTASEDGTAKLWDIKARRCIATIKHGYTDEVLRSSFIGSPRILATCGADGLAHIWKPKDHPDGSAATSITTTSSKFEKVFSLDHEKGQIYVCDLIREEEATLMTAADDILTLWDLAKMERTSSWRFGALGALGAAAKSSPKVHQPLQPQPPTSQGSSNPDNPTAFIFDAKPNPVEPSVVAVCLSDGTVRLLDSRARPMAASHVALFKTGTDTGSVPGTASRTAVAEALDVHATCLAWEPSSAMHMLCGLGSGQTALLDCRQLRTLALLSGHERPCFGAAFLPNSQRYQAISWSSDSSVRLWDLSGSLEAPPEADAHEIQLDQVGAVGELGMLGSTFQAPQPNRSRVFMGTRTGSSIGNSSSNSSTLGGYSGRPQRRAASVDLSTGGLAAPGAASKSESPHGGFLDIYAVGEPYRAVGEVGSVEIPDYPILCGALGAEGQLLLGGGTSSGPISPVHVMSLDCLY
jgi:WD40 repeat protein